MRALVHVLVGLTGLGILASVAHTTVLASGGYDASGTPLTLALAAGLAVGSLAIGTAWRDRRFALVALLLLTLTAGEVFMLAQTVERVIDRRETAQAPAREAASARVKAADRINQAEAALNAIPVETARLRAALASKATADSAVISQAADKGCRENCRALLQAQVDAASREVEAARGEITAERAKAMRDLSDARAVLAALKPPPSANAVADRIGISGWLYDLIVAALYSVASNGLGAALIAFASHGWHRRPREIEAVAIPAQPPVARIVVTEAASASAAEPNDEAFDVSIDRDPAAEANAFARDAFQPSPSGTVALRDIRRAYHAWSAERRLEPLPDKIIGAELSKLFSRVGLARVERPAPSIAGIAWSPKFPSIAA